ncbi:hypothetical protein NEOKW01_1071 [Nematocida sp. AWRm80]|nr:hypothetical protein NEOKW01_1071 [Nematocida sp. AWRm80]
MEVRWFYAIIFCVVAISKMHAMETSGDICMAISIEENTGVVGMVPQLSGKELENTNKIISQAMAVGIILSSAVCGYFIGLYIDAIIEKSRTIINKTRSFVRMPRRVASYLEAKGLYIPR